MQSGDRALVSKRRLLKGGPKTNFEADHEDDQRRAVINSNIEARHWAACWLDGLARARAKELDEQKRHLIGFYNKASGP